MKSSLFLICLLMAISGLTACSEKPSPPPSQEFSANAMVAVFENFVPMNRKDLVWCLEVDGKDPTNIVLAALLAKGGNIAPASECTYDIDEPGSFHIETKQNAMFVRLRNFERTSPTQALVEFSNYQHGMNGSFGNCLLEYFNKEWQVSCTSKGVS